MVKPQGLVVGIRVKGFLNPGKLCLWGDLASIGLECEVFMGDLPESNILRLSSSLAPDSSSNRGMSLLRLCHAEKFDMLVSIIRVVYSNSSLTMPIASLSGFNSRLSRAAITFLRYPQPWKFRLSRPSILTTRASSFCQKLRAVGLGRRRVA